MGKIWKRIRRLVLVALLLQWAYLVALLWVDPPVTITMLSNKIKGHAINYEPIGFEEQGNNIKLAALSGEDQNFLTHYGLDFSAIRSAMDNNLKGKAVRGGSTISQQTAKNIFLWQGRDWIRKGLEAYTTLCIELVWGKKRILEHYLNVAEMGEGIYGVQAAAQFYFKKNADDLSQQQAALLIASLPSPKKMNPNKPSKVLNRKKAWIVKQMKIMKQHKEMIEFVEEK